jgi:CBS domain-containing protein
MKIEELMTRDPIAVGPETPLKDVAAILVDRRISGVPVLDDRRAVLGVVSEADILVKEAGPDPHDRRLIAWLLGGRHVDEQKLLARTAAEAMTSPAVTVRTGRRVSEAARLMTEHGIKRLPVVDAAGVLVGIVTRSDLVRAFARTDEEIEREIRDLVLRTLWIEEPELDLCVERGEVRLSGTVQRRSDTELLERFAPRVPGVVSVQSTLRWAWDDTKPVGEADASVADTVGRR